MSKTSEKKNQTEILEIKSSLNQVKNIVESHSSRLEQVEDRISGLKDKIDIKEKTRRVLRQKTQELQKEYTRTQQFMKRPSLQIMGIEEEMQAKSIHNVFNKIIAENSPNLENKVPTQVQKDSRTPSRHNKLEPL
jgi:chromosome segregation ATPase